MFLITSKYASFLGIFYILLTLRVIRYRRLHRISLGTGGDENLERLVCSHSNFAEFAPLGLILLALVESAGWPAPVIHAVGISLCLGRILHSQALPLGSFRLRVLGMVLTISSIVCSSMLLGPFARTPKPKLVLTTERFFRQTPG